VIILTNSVTSLQKISAPKNPATRETTALVVRMSDQTGYETTGLGKVYIYNPKPRLFSLILGIP
jgi:hypothetical protein